MKPEILFARYAPATLEPKDSIGAKWQRLLARLDLPRVAKGKRTAIKIHLGGGTGFTTIHPFFVRGLVARVKEAGAREVFVTDTHGAVAHAIDRGYTEEVLGCPLVPMAGPKDKDVVTVPVQPAFRGLSEVHIGKEILGAEALIDFSHLKAHGACGFGGAAKNLSMGCVDERTRGVLHGLEGGLEWDREACTLCKTCEENCPNKAISFPGDTFSVFYHNCKLCKHCVLICPEKAIEMRGGAYADFQEGLALATARVLDGFPRENQLYITMLMNITVFCDCWGMTTPSLVPDIGIIAGSEIVSIEQAALDLVRTEDLIPGSLPRGWELRDGRHLFERIHGKDPFVVIQRLSDMGFGSRGYTTTEVA
jgi:uncharacterized Fe-S center protein